MLGFYVMPLDAAALSSGQGARVRDQLGTSHNLTWRREWRRTCFLSQIISRPLLIAPMFFRYPPSSMLKDLRAPLSYIQFKVDRLQIILVAKKYISTCRNCSSVGCLKCVQFRYWFRLHYSQTRSSVPVANELMNSFTEKWFRLLIQ